MSLKTVFRFLVIFEWISLLCAVAIGLFCERYLPEELKGYIEVRDTLPFSNSEYLLILFIIIWIIASVRLFLFSSNSRKIYLIICIVNIFVEGFFGPYVESGWESAFIQISQITTGLLIALMYFSPIRENFNIQGV